MRKSVVCSRPLVALTTSVCAVRRGDICSNRGRQCCEGIALTTMPAPSRALRRSPVTCTHSGIMWPGRNNSFTRWAAMYSRTASSYAQRRTSCRCFRPSTIEIAVPHAPAPMIAIWLICASVEKLRLGVFRHPCNVLTVLHNNQECGRRQHRNSGRFFDFPEQEGRYRKRCTGQD